MARFGIDKNDKELKIHRLENRTEKYNLDDTYNAFMDRRNIPHTKHC